MDYIIKREIENLIDQIAISNIRGFYPSLIYKKFGIQPIDFIPLLEELANWGVLEKRYILRNPENPIEVKEFNESKVPLGEYFDDFHFGDEFLVTENDIDVFYNINKGYRDKLKKKLFIVL